MLPVVKLLMVPVRSTLLIFEEVEIELILIVLSILEIVNLVTFSKSYILIVSIVDVSSNLKVNVLGGGERIILVELASSIVPASNVEIVPGVFIVAISNVSLICSIDNVAVPAFGPYNWIELIRVDSSVPAVCSTFVMVMSEMNLDLMSLI